MMVMKAVKEGGEFWEEVRGLEGGERSVRKLGRQVGCSVRGVRIEA